MPYLYAIPGPGNLEPATKGYKTERSEGGPPSTAMQELGITLPL